MSPPNAPMRGGVENDLSMQGVHTLHTDNRPRPSFSRLEPTVRRHCCIRPWYPYPYFDARVAKRQFEARCRCIIDRQHAPNLLSSSLSQSTGKETISLRSIFVRHVVHESGKERTQGEVRMHYSTGNMHQPSLLISLSQSNIGQ